MENDHPRAMDFLRMDCRNVTSFFRKNGAHPATARSLFDFILDSDLSEEDHEARLKVCNTLCCAPTRAKPTPDLTVTLAELRHMKPSLLSSCFLIA